MFPYDETRDQLSAIEEIKKDMEKPVRWIVYCVGMWVTVKPRWLFVLHLKQLLRANRWLYSCQQRYWLSSIMRRSVNDSPVIRSIFRCLVVSVPRKEQNETIKGIKAGTVDIVIGTHRLLSQDLVFKDLGLLIVDEEQRFGVTHKEKLKSSRPMWMCLHLRQRRFRGRFICPCWGYVIYPLLRLLQRIVSLCRPMWWNIARRLYVKPLSVSLPEVGKCIICTTVFKEFRRWRTKFLRLCLKLELVWTWSNA